MFRYDFKQTLNPHSKLDRYPPIPKVKDLFVKLAGGQKFTKLDSLPATKNQNSMWLSIPTRGCIVIYTRLPYGISSAPGIFQGVMENLLRGIPGVIIYLDDILVTGHTTQEHLKSLEEVLRRLEEGGLIVKKSKCEFMVPSVQYLGHRINDKGLHPLQEKVRAIEEAPVTRWN